MSEARSGIEPLFVSRKDAAKALAVSVRALDYLTGEGRLKTRRIGGRVLIAVAELKRFASRDDSLPMVPKQAMLGAC